MNNTLVIIFVSFFILTILSVLFLIIFFTRRKREIIYNKNGFLFLEIDLNKDRIKCHNKISKLLNYPFFLKKIDFSNGKWRKLKNFKAILDKKSLMIFESALENKKNTIISFEKKRNKLSNHFTNINFDLNFVENSRGYVILNWEENNYHNKLVFEPINTNINYLIKQENKYIACVFLLNTKNINSINEFIKSFKQICIQNRIFGIKVILDWNKLFFVFSFQKFRKIKAVNSIKTIKKYASTSKPLFKSFYAFHSKLLANESIYNYELIFDYLKSYTNNAINYWLPKQKNKIEGISLFEEKYTKLFDQLKSDKIIDLRPIYLNDFNEKNIKTNMLLVEKKFKSLGISNPEILTSLDIYKNLYLEIYKEKNENYTQAKILTISDHVFNLIDNNDITGLLANSNSFIQLINITNKRNLLKTKKKIETIQERNPEYWAAIKLNEINSDIIFLINKWVKIIWIDSKLTNNLNNPDTLLYTKFLLKKAGELEISVIFEKLDHKNFKKLIYNSNIKMFYTRNQPKNNKFISINKESILKGNLWIKN